MNQLAKIFAYTLAMAAMALVIGEGAARTALPWLQAHWTSYYYRSYMEVLLKPDPNLLWTGRPHAGAIVRNSASEEISYLLNSIGWREEDFLPASGKNVLVLGDAVAFGMGVSVENGFPEALERELEGVKVWNAGVIGYAPDQYYLLADRWLGLYPWSALVVQLSNNDLADVGSHEWLDLDGNPVAAGQPPLWIDSSRRANLEHSDFELLNLASYFFTLGRNETLSSSSLEKALLRFDLSLRALLSRARGAAVPVILLQATDWGESIYGVGTSQRFRQVVLDLSQEFKIPLLEPNREFTLVDLLPYPDLHWRAEAHAKVAAMLKPMVEAALRQK